jgi:stage II sporulation protein AA (anti-sigma F factor antagonist)
LIGFGLPAIVRSSVYSAGRLSVSIMAATTERLDDIVVLHLVATVDGQAAVEFERNTVAELDAGLRRFVIDLTEVRIITSAGIRVLLLLRKRLGAEGGLVLCGMNERVKTLLDIAGLSQQLPSVGSRSEAVTYLRELRGKRPTDSIAAPAGPPSPVSRLLAQLLGAPVTADRNAECGQPSALALRIAELLQMPGPEKR